MSLKRNASKYMLLTYTKIPRELSVGRSCVF